MSILDYPRANFRGIFRTNPSTSNNDDVMPSVIDGATSLLGPDLLGKTDEQARQYLEQCVDMQNYDNPPGVKPFIRSGWNPYGDFSTSFDDAFVRSVAYAPGSSTNSHGEDPLVGVKIEIIGSKKPDGSPESGAMICDLDPTGLVTTQLYIGGIRLSYADDAGQPAEVEIYHDTRAFQDWLNFNTTVGNYDGEQNFVGIGCIWQCVIPADALPTYESLNLNSPALQRLWGQARLQGGLALRFFCFEVEPGYTDEYLDQQFQQGNAAANDAYGYLVGTLGVWSSDEPQTEPAGRKLQATYRRAPPDRYIPPGDPDQGRPTLYWSAMPGMAPAALPGCPYPWMGPPALIGNVVAKVLESPAVVVLDIVGAFPKYGFRNPDGPVLNDPPQGFDELRRKAWVGEVELAVVTPYGEILAVGDVDYGYDDYALYEDYGGIVEVSYDPNETPYSMLAEGRLILRGKPSGDLNAGVVMVQETLLRVVTDDRAAYLAPETGQYPIWVKVYERGGPTTRDVTLYLKEYKNIIQLKPGTGDTCASPGNQYRTNQSVDSRTSPLTVDNPEQNPPQCPKVSNYEPLLDIHAEGGRIVIPAGFSGWWPIPVSVNQQGLEGAAILAIQQEGDYVYGTVPPASEGGQAQLGVAGVPMWSTKNYSAIRVFQNTDFSRLYENPNGLQWAEVYPETLRLYYLLFPAMSTYIPLNLASAVTSPYAADIIKKRLGTPADPVFFSTLNMPATRTLSPARVRLLVDFINQELAKQKH